MCNCYSLQAFKYFPGLVPTQEGNPSELTDGWILTTVSSVERSLRCQHQVPQLFTLSINYNISHFQTVLSFSNTKIKTQYHFFSNHTVIKINIFPLLNHHTFSNYKN